MYNGVSLTIAILGQHDSIQSLYNEWINGRGGLPSIKSVVEHYPSFWLPVSTHGKAWKKAMSERRLLCALIEDKGVEAMESMFEAQGAKRWEGLLATVRNQRTERKQKVRTHQRMRMRWRRIQRSR